MKKALSILLTLGLVFSMAACGDKKEEAADTSAKTDTQKHRIPGIRKLPAAVWRARKLYILHRQKIFFIGSGLKKE